MNSREILALGAVAGATIFLGLPIGRIQSVNAGVRSFLSAAATGILLFLFWDVTTAAVEPVEDALTEGDSGRFRVRRLDLAPPQPVVARSGRCVDG